MIETEQLCGRSIRGEKQNNEGRKWEGETSMERRKRGKMRDEVGGRGGGGGVKRKKDGERMEKKRDVD